MRLAFVLILAVFLMGCATTRQPVSYDNTNIRLERIERNIIEKNKEMEEIRYSVDELSSKVDQISGTAGVRSVRPAVKEEYDDDGDPIEDAGLSADSGKIIRVPVSEKEVQLALKNAGYYDGAIDGKIGKKSVGAIKNFQKDFGLKVDGIIGRQTWNEMKKYLE